MNVMDLMAKISLDSQDFNQGLESSKSNFSKFGSALSSGAKTVGKVATASIAAIGTAVTGTSAAFIKAASGTASLADTIDKESQKLGISATAYQEWSAILQHTGGSVDNLKPALKTLSKEIMNNSDAFQQLGISQEEMKGKSVEEVLSMTISKLQDMPEGIERTRLATQLLGKSSVELGALLNTSAEDTEAMRQKVHELGGVMSDDAVKAGAAFKDSLQDMKTAMSGAKNNLMAEFLPSLTTAMDGLTALFTGDSSGIEKIKQGIASLASKLNEMMPKVISALSGIAEALISALPDFVQTFASQLPSILSSLIPILVNALVKLADALADALPKVIEVIQQNIGTITQGLTKIILTIGKLIVQIFPKVFPMLIKVGVQLIKELAKGLTQNMSAIIKSIIECVQVIVQELTNPETLTELLRCGIELTVALIKGILENLPQILGCIGEVVGNIVSFLFTDGIPMLFDAAVSVFGAIGDGLLKAWDYITGKIGDLLGKILGGDGIGGWLQGIIDKACEIFGGIGTGLLDAFGAVGEGIWGAITTLGGWIKDKFYEAMKWINDVGEWIGKKLGEALNIAKKYIVGPLKSLGDYIGGTLYDLTHDDYTPISDEDWNAMSANYVGGVSAWEKAGENDGKKYVKGQEKGLDIHSPSKKMAYIGKMVMAGFADGMEEESNSAFDDIDATFGKFHPELNVDAVIGQNGVLKARAGSASTTEEKTLEKIYAALEYMAKQGFNFTLPVFIGNKQIDEQTVDSVNRLQLRSGGQVNV